MHLPLGRSKFAKREFRVGPDDPQNVAMPEGKAPSPTPPQIGDLDLPGGEVWADTGAPNNAPPLGEV